MPVPRLAGAGDLAGGDLQRGEQGGGAVPDVVVGAPLRQPGLHRQHRRGPVQRLDLGLLVHAQHDRVLRRGQVQPDDVGDLGDQLGVGGELERLRPATAAPRTPARPVATVRVADPQVAGQQPGRPVRHPELLRRRRQRRRHDLAVVHLPRPARPRLVVQARQTRPRHTGPARSITVGRDTPTRSAIAVFDSPSAASNTIRARCANPARTVDDRVNRANPSRSPSRNANAGAGRFAIPHSDPNQPSNN